MEEDKKNNKRFFFVAGICVLLVGLFILLNTYAFWRIKGEQTESNYVVGACLNFRFIEEHDDVTDQYIGGFTLEDWPMSDEDGIATPGYTFEIENTCANDVDYQVILEKLSVANKTNEDYFADNLIKLQLNNGAITTYENLTDVTPEDVTYDNGQTTILEAAQLLTGTLAGNDTVRYNLRMWISSESTADDIGKVFRSKIKVFAGQGVPEPEYAITDESCFDFDASTGTITDYDYNTCGTESLVIPATIGGVIVKKISFPSNYYGGASAQVYGYVDISNATGLEIISTDSFTGYRGNDKKLVIPDSVKEIGGAAFSSFNGSLVLGKGISKIGISAFNKYQGLDEELVIPGNDTIIESNAFQHYDGPKVIFEDGVKKIGDGAFDYYLGEGQDLIIPDTVTSFYAFPRFNGNKLKLSNNADLVGGFNIYVGSGQDLTIPSSVTVLIPYAFSKYTGENAQLDIEEGVQYIGNNCFQSYIGNDFIIPSTVTNIYQNAFKDFTGKITFNMTPAQYANVNKNNNWKNASATVVCLENNVEVPCE